MFFLDFLSNSNLFKEFFIFIMRIFFELEYYHHMRKFFVYNFLYNLKR